MCVLLSVCPCVYACVFSCLFLCCSQFCCPTHTRTYNTQFLREAAIAVVEKDDVASIARTFFGGASRIHVYKSESLCSAPFHGALLFTILTPPRAKISLFAHLPHSPWQKATRRDQTRRTAVGQELQRAAGSRSCHPMKESLLAWLHDYTRERRIGWLFRLPWLWLWWAPDPGTVAERKSAWAGKTDYSLYWKLLQICTEYHML